MKNATGKSDSTNPMPSLSTKPHFFTPSTIHKRVLTRIITNNSKPPPFLDKTFWKTKIRVLKKMSSCVFTMGSKLWEKNVLKEIIYNVVR